MKTQLATSESAKLIELGVSRSKANGIWLPHVTEVQPYTLADILDILPKEINCEHLEIGTDDGEWYAEYNNTTLPSSYSFAPELIDALYSLLVWCLEKGYVKV